jgi:hypothetical protein
MKLSKPLVHLRLHQCQFFYWDPKIDPREPEYIGDLHDGSFFML